MVGTSLAREPHVALRKTVRRRSSLPQPVVTTGGKLAYIGIMRARPPDSVRWLAAALWLALGGCVAASASESSGTRGAPLDGAGAGGGPIAGASGESGGATTGGSESEYRVTVHATQTSLCPGQCAELTAEAEQGHAPYRYDWSGNVGHGPGPHTVCPEGTTSYSVTASDTAIEAEELGRASRSVSGSIVIEVQDDEGGSCAMDGGAPVDPEGRELCSISIPYEDESGYPVLTTWGEGQSLTTDAEGNLYLAGTYTAAIDLGDGFNELETTPSVFIAKYSAGCELLWHKHFTVFPHAVRFNSVALSPSGELIATGWVLGQVSFDAITIGDPGISGFVQGLLVGFDPSDGHALWARTAGSESDGTGFYNLSIDSAGDLIVDGWAGPKLSIGGVELANERSGALIAKLSAAGEYRFAQVFEGSETYLHHALGPDDVIAVSSLSRENSVVYAGQVVGSPGLWRHYVAVLDRNGALLASRDPDPQLTEINSSIGIGAVHFDSHGDFWVEHGDYVLESSGVAVPERLSKLDVKGSVLSTFDVSPPGYQKIPFSQGTFALDSRDDIIHTDQIDNPTDSAADAGIRAEGKDPSDVIVQKLDPSGALLWRHVFDSDVFERAWGLTIATDDTIWVGHGTDDDVDPWRGTLRITKLAP